MKNTKLIALLLSTGILFAGCGADKQAQETDTNKTEQTVTAEETENTDDAPAMVDNGTPEEKDSMENTTPQVSLSMDDAIEAFRANFDGEDIDITKIGLDLEDGAYQYEITGQKDGEEYEAEIDANSGDIIKSSIEDGDDLDSPIDFASIIDPMKAMEAALSGQEGAYVKEWTLETDDGKLVYEIDIEKGSDKVVDALTGEVYKD